MKTPFPGLDPYLEHPARWQDGPNRPYARPHAPPPSPEAADWATTLVYPPHPDA